MSRPQLSILSYTFSGLNRYAKGQELTEAEATFLNRHLNEAARNAFKARVAKELEGEFPLSDETLTRLQTDMDQYLKAFDFTVTRRRETIDPVLREARKIIKPLVLAALRNKGVELEDLPEGHLEKYLDRALSQKPDVMAEARRRIEAIRNVGETALEVLGD